MTVGLIADLHDHLTNFDAFLRQTHSRLDALWIAGDIGTPETLASVCDRFDRPIYAVAGNTEAGHDLRAYERLASNYLHLHWGSSEPFIINQEQPTFALCHFADAAYACARKSTVAIVAFGHSHQPSLKKVGTTWLVNPGTLAGVFSSATYTLVNTAAMTFQLERLYKPV